MLGRRSIWSKPEIIELSRQFIPATDEVWRLQNGDDPECRHFQKIADKGHYRSHRTTRQGIYVCTASGVLLGSLNSHNVDAVLKMMRDSLRKYETLDRKERLLAADADILPAHRWEDSWPQDGLDLTMFARDLPESCDPQDERGAAWNKDRVWFSDKEKRRWLPRDLSAIQPGDSWDVPADLVSRLVRFSVVDTVRGQTSFYTGDEIGDSAIRITAEEVTPAAIQLSIEGQTSAESETSRGRDYRHGIRTRLLGRATWDREGQQFLVFELVATGSRWGRTVFNGRQRQLEESPVGFVFRLTSPNAPLIAPSFLFAYGADWVRGPR